MSKLLEFLENAGQEDLDEIDKEIETLYGRIEKAKKVREFITSGLNGNPDKVLSVVAQEENETKESASPNRIKVLQYLGTVGKPISGGKVMDDIRLPRGSQTNLLKHPWFIRKDDGYVLTKYGKDSYRKICQPRT